MSAKIYLISCPLQNQALQAALPQQIIELVSSLDSFFVENAKTARAFLNTLKLKTKLQEIEFVEISKDDSVKKLEQILLPLQDGRKAAGVLSEVGAPCVADPGSNLVLIANRLGIEVEPLVGPSAVHMAIISSGLNGQNFCFNGYLPIKSPELDLKIRELEKKATSQQQAQFFIETAYRVEKLFNKLLQICKDSTLLSLSCDLGSSAGFSRTNTVAEWKKISLSLKDKQAVIGIG